MVAALTARSPADLSRAETQLAETQLPEAPRDKFPLASRPFYAHRTSKPTERFWNARLPLWWHISRQRGKIRAARADGDAHGCLRSSPTLMGRGMPDAAVARRGSSPECQTQQSGMPGVAGALPDVLPDALLDAVSDALPYTLQGDGTIPYRSKPGDRSVFTVASRRVAFRRSAGRFTSPQVDG
ncbi:hypothetical protein T492DRAFT_943522 [Pavlovales sp. CCMP2436]|nr:hypothetical protein T492DRAFT_943522 [Pavlovales sp. CCMP2436]